MKRIYSYVIIAALLLCIIAVSLAIVSRTRALEAANHLAVEINSQALTSWDAALVINNASPLLLEQSNEERYYSYFNALRRLGDLQEITDINFTVELPTILLPDSEGVANYRMNATFSHGQAEVRISLVRRDGRWWFSDYLVLTPLLAS